MSVVGGCWRRSAESLDLDQRMRVREQRSANGRHTTRDDQTTRSRSRMIYAPRDEHALGTRWRRLVSGESGERVVPTGEPGGCALAQHL